MTTPQSKPQTTPSQQNSTVKPAVTKQEPAPQNRGGSMKNEPQSSDRKPSSY